MTEAPISEATKAATNAQIAMSAAWLAVAWLDRGSGPRRRLSEDFFDAMRILIDELAAAGFLERYRDTATGALRLPSIEPSGNRAEKFGPAESDMTISRRTLKGTNP